MKFTWITQGGFVFESAGFRLVIDPYLSDVVEKKSRLTRMVSPVFTVATLNPDALFCTHDHMDHFDPVTAPEIMKKFPACVLAGPSSVVRMAHSAGIAKSRMREVSRGVPVKFGPFEMIPVMAIHSDKDAVGIIINCNGKTVYISGDSEYSPAIADEVLKVGNGKIDMMFICINGKWGNMNLPDALKVVKAVKPKAAIPMHYDLFKENSEEPQPFVEECNAMGVRSFEMKQGREYSIWELS